MNRDNSSATTTVVSIPVMESKPLHTGHRVVVGVIEAETLVDRHFVPRRNIKKNEGYQRAPSMPRVNRLAKEIRDRKVDLPTAILVSLRKTADEVLTGSGTHLVLNLNGAPLNIVDGQHRVGALQTLMEVDPDQFADFLIPFVCVLGASELVEMEQFYVVNSTAKSVRTDLAYDLLKQRASHDATYMMALEHSGRSWQVKGQEIVEALAQAAPWRGRIRFPNEPIADTTIGNASLVNSLQPLLGSAYFGALATPNQVKVLTEYWNGIKQTLPDCFKDDVARSCTLQKATGAMTMHALLLTVLEHVRQNGDSVIEADSYALVLSDPLRELQGENHEGSVVSGSDFWLAGAEGAAGMYSNNAGRRVLLGKIKTLLPDLTVE